MNGAELDVIVLDCELMLESFFIEGVLRSIRKIERGLDGNYGFARI
jgi:hypothetical protein